MDTTTEIKTDNSTTSPSIMEFAKALAAAQGEMRGAKKDNANPFFKSRYADLASVIGAIREPFAKHGLAYVQIPGHDEKGYFVDTILMHASGEWIKGRIRMNPVKQDPQGIGSVVTYMRRYALQAMAGLEAEDDDENAASSPKSGHSDKPLHGATLDEDEKARIKASEEQVAAAIISIKKCKTTEDLKDLGKQFTPEFKDELTKMDMEALREAYNERLNDLKGTK